MFIYMKKLKLIDGKSVELIKSCIRYYLENKSNMNFIQIMNLLFKLHYDLSDNKCTGFLLDSTTSSDGIIISSIEFIIYFVDGDDRDRIEINVNNDSNYEFNITVVEDDEVVNKFDKNNLNEFLKL